MKKLTTLFLLALTLGGCSLFQKKEDSTTTTGHKLNPQLQQLQVQQLQNKPRIVLQRNLQLWFQRQ